MARKPKAPVAPDMPPRPPMTPREVELSRQITAGLQDLVKRGEQRCLDNAVLLAQRAARRQGPLVEHFMELGRRFQDTLDAPQEPRLRVVKGGVA